MKIWIDTQVNTQIRANDCGAPLYVAPIKFLPIEEVRPIPTHVFKHVPALYIQPCRDGRWLICNPVGSGKLAVLDSHAFLVFEQFRDGKTLSEVAEATFVESLTTLEQFVTLLHQLGFLHDIHATSPLSAQSQENMLTAWLHVTNACNLRCHYCYLRKTNEAMADDTAKRAIDAIIRSALKHHFKGIMLKYAGGEASLRADSVFAAHDYAVEQARQNNLTLHAQMLSNGVLASQHLIEHLKERQIALSISLDGIGASHDNQRPFINGMGSFKFIDRTIRRLLLNGIVPHILITVSQRNLAGLLDLMEYILEHRLPFTISYYRDNECATSNDLQFSDTHMISTMQDVFALIEQRLPRQNLLNALIDKVDLSNAHTHTCGVGRNYLVIDQRGGVAKCQADIKSTITTIDAEDPLQVLQEDRTGIQNIPVEEKQGCRQCAWRHWCTGGCPLLTYRITGRYDIKSPNCNIYQNLIPEVLRLEALRLLAYEEPLFISSDTPGLCPLTR